MSENTAKSPGLKDASGNSLNLYGVFPMSLTILGKTVIHEVWVCNKINDLIIGADFINSHHLQYNTLSRSIHFWNKPHAPIVCLKEVIHFEALTTTIVKKKILETFLHHKPTLHPFLMVIIAFYNGVPLW